MNPFSINPIALLAGIAFSLATGFITGFEVQGWRKGTEIAELKAQSASNEATEAQGALADLAAASAQIHNAASAAATDVSALNTKLDAIRKDFKNARPLPVDCRPDASRLHDLSSSVDAANQAAAGK